MNYARKVLIIRYLQSQIVKSNKPLSVRNCLLIESEEKEGIGSETPCPKGGTS